MADIHYWRGNQLDFHPNRAAVGEKYPFEYWSDIPVGSMWQIKERNTLKASYHFMIAMDLSTGHELRIPQSVIPEVPMMFMGLVVPSYVIERGCANTPSTFQFVWFWDSRHWKTAMAFQDIRDFYWRWTLVSP